MNFEERTHYEMLGVARDATVDEIKEAFHDIARLYHPDSQFFSDLVEFELSTGDVDKFKLITVAYRTLMSPAKRTAYDQTLGAEVVGWDDDDDERMRTVRDSTQATVNKMHEQERKTVTKQDRMKQSLWGQVSTEDGAAPTESVVHHKAMAETIKEVRRKREEEDRRYAVRMIQMGVAAVGGMVVLLAVLVMR